MPIDFIQEQVDIYQLPENKTLGKDGSWFTLGDLHGNSMKLIFMLIKHGVISGLSVEDYQHLVTIYQKADTRDLNKDLLADFDNILNRATFTPRVGIRLIGDVLADRGANDIFTLKVLAKMEEYHVPYEIDLSNHDIEFIEAYEGACDIMRMSEKPSLELLQNIYKSTYIVTDEGIWYYEYKFERKSLKPLAPAEGQSLQTLLDALDVNEKRRASPEELKQITSCTKNYQLLISDRLPCQGWYSNFTPSMENLQALMDGKDPVITREDVNKLVEKAYKPAVKVLSYALSTDGQEISIFSHAAIGFESDSESDSDSDSDSYDFRIIRLLAEKMGVPFHDETAVLLAQTIDAINEQFQVEYVAKGAVHTLYEAANMDRRPWRYTPPRDDPFAAIMWNDNYSIFDRPDVHPKYGYRIRYGHGHDSKDPAVQAKPSSNDTVINVDNYLGKGIKNNKGEYTVINSEEARPTVFLETAGGDDDVEIPKDNDHEFNKLHHAHNPDSLQPFQQEQGDIAIKVQQKQYYLEKIHFDAHLQIFRDKIAEMQDKINELEVKTKNVDNPKYEEYQAKINNYRTGKEAVETLCASLEAAKTTFLDANRVNQSEAEGSFLNACREAIVSAREPLAQHRGVLKVLNDFFNELLGRTWENSFFKTDSTKKLQAFNDEVNGVETSTEVDIASGEHMKKR